MTVLLKALFHKSQNASCKMDSKTYRVLNFWHKLECQSLLERAIKAEKDLPSTFVISPFRKIKEQLILQIKKNQFFENCFAEFDLAHKRPKPAKIHHWCRKQIGTVNTFQGKESETVIFVLGADQKRKGAAE